MIIFIGDKEETKAGVFFIETPCITGQKLSVLSVSVSVCLLTRAAQIITAERTDL